MSNVQRLVASLLGVGLLALSLAACSQPSGGAPAGSAPAAKPAAQGAASPAAAGAASPAAASAPVKLTVGILPISELIPLWVAQDEGYFTAEGLTLETTVLAGGAAGIPALESNSLQLMYSNVASAMIAAEQGLDLHIVAPGSVLGISNPDPTGMLVRSDSGLTSGNMNGKRVATNTLKNITDVYGAEMLARKGVDTKTLQWTEVPFPQMPDALINGALDAIITPEPFLTIAKNSGKATVIGYPFLEVQPNFEAAQYVALERWLRNNADTLARFRRSLLRGVEYVNANRNRLGDWAVQYTKLDPALKDQVAFPGWHTQLDRKSLEQSGELFQRYDLLKRPPNLDQLLWQ
ncbi:MAG TPA: ABC transporter substrate-binding protein [Chloroflexota bacterium]|jgi:NitT/TauT family transport system substrate-binding protein